MNQLQSDHYLADQRAGRTLACALAARGVHKTARPLSARLIAPQSGRGPMRACRVAQPTQAPTQIRIAHQRAHTHDGIGPVEHPACGMVDEPERGCAHDGAGVVGGGGAHDGAGVGFVGGGDRYQSESARVEALSTARGEALSTARVEVLSTARAEVLGHVRRGQRRGA